MSSRRSPTLGVARSRATTCRTATRSYWPPLHLCTSAPLHPVAPASLHPCTPARLPVVRPSTLGPTAGAVPRLEADPAPRGLTRRQLQDHHGDQRLDPNPIPIPSRIPSRIPSPNPHFKPNPHPHPHPNQVANISTALWAGSETQSTLKFAQRAQHVQNYARANEDNEAKTRLRQARARVIRVRLRVRVRIKRRRCGCGR